MGSLRQMAVEQQVALLFTLVFGLLFAATVVALLFSLRDATPARALRQARVSRDLRALWLMTCGFWLAWISGPVVASALFAIISFLALRELITLMHTRRSDHRSLILIFFIVLPAQYVIVAVEGYGLFEVFIPVYVFLAIPVISALSGDPRNFLERNAKIHWGIMVCVYGLSHAPALLGLDLPGFDGRGAFLLFFLFAVTMVAQQVQEWVARRIRSKPTARHISRSFSTRAWFIGSFVAAWVGALLYWATPFKPAQALLIGFATAASGMLGDFVMRALKRDAGVDHWGNAPAVTGAVGLLDRIAPLCFAAPVFFHLLRWLYQA